MGAGLSRVRRQTSYVNDYAANLALLMTRISNPGRAGGPITLLAQALLTILSTALILRLWRANLIVPFNYEADTIFELTLAKSIADGGWIWFIERLGAPFGLEIVAFPQNLTFSSLLMKVIALFTSEPGLVLNLFWLLAITLTSVVCHAALRSLTVSRATSFVISTLYALLPYTLFRNVAHASLTYIFVPVVAAFAVVVLASSRPSRDGAEKTPHIPRALLLAACVTIGFDYVYTAFFACFFLVMAGAVGAIHGRRWEPLKRAIPAIALISLCAAINLAPSLSSWHQQGLPPTMDYKSAAEAEIYGLKIRHVLTALIWRSKDAPTVAFPLENENASVTLGVVGAIGFLLALAYGLLGTRRGKDAMSWSAGVLTILGTLFATIGGFGAIFNVLVTPDIRAYNRIIVFLAFFAFLVLGLKLDGARLKFAALARVWRKPAWGAPLVTIALLGILLIGLADQGKMAKPLIARYANDKARADVEREMVRRIEQTLPHLQQVYQLPETPFPPDPGLERMGPYDHGRPYLWSQRLRWSWPNFSLRQDAWIRAIGMPGQDKFITNLVISGFDGLWLDRFGYKPSELATVEAELTAELGKPAATSRDGRYVLFSLQAQRERWLATGTEADRQQARETLMDAVQVRFDRGFYEEEVSPDGQRRWRWSKRFSALTVRNPTARTRRAEFRAQLGGNLHGVVTIKSGPYTVARDLTAGPTEVVVPVQLSPNSSSRIEFSFEGPRVEAPRDSRSLYFTIVNATIQEIK